MSNEIEFLSLIFALCAICVAIAYVNERRNNARMNNAHNSRVRNLNNKITLNKMLHRIEKQRIELNR